jgi:ferritin-like protein
MSNFNAIGSEHLTELSDRIKRLEKSDIDGKLLAMHKHLLSEVNARILSSQKSLISGLLDVILQEDKTAIKQLQQELQTTAGAAAKSAEIAKQYATTELTGSVELLRSLSYMFAHGE